MPRGFDRALPIFSPTRETLVFFPPENLLLVDNGQLLALLMAYLLMMMMMTTTVKPFFEQSSRSHEFQNDDASADAWLVVEIKTLFIKVFFLTKGDKQCSCTFDFSIGSVC